MKAIRTSVMLALALAVPIVQVAGADAPAKPASSPYTVDVYDPKRSAADDLKATLAKAKAEDKHVLIQVGGDWCSWCHLMSKYFGENEKVAQALTKDYLIVKVNYSEENRNKEFLSQYPRISVYPHLFVLDADGKLLHSQGTAELEEGRSYNEGVVLTFLSKWATKK
jgi:thiol:disulfide interchange protein